MKSVFKPFIALCVLAISVVSCKKQGDEPFPTPGGKLTASFTVVGDGRQGPCTDTFTVTSTGAERYSWNFGDGSIAMTTNKTTSHLYNGSFTNDTTYKVTLVAYAGKDSAIDTKNVLVKQRMPIPVGQMPIADFSFSDTAVAAKFESPCTVKFTNTSQYGETYLWDFGNGVTSKATDTMITYTLTGATAQTFNVKLTVTNVNGSKVATKPVPINPKGVEPLPENVDFTYTPTNPKVGDTVIFTAASNITHAAKYIWQFNDGPLDSSGRVVKHVYNTAKDYSTTLFVRNNSGNKSRKDTLISVLDIAPKASFTVSAGPYSISNPITFTSTSTPATGLSYKWVFGDGTEDVTSGAIVQHAYKEGGSKTVTLYVKNSAGSSDYTYEIPDIQANKVTITKIDLLNSPSFYYYMGTTKYTWDQRSVGSGDYDGSDPDFSVQVFYNGGFNSYTSIWHSGQFNPSWDFSGGGTVSPLVYPKANFSTSHFIYLIENSSAKAGLPVELTRNACDNITFKPGDYVKGIIAYPASIVIEGTSPDKDKQLVRMKLYLKWE